jgi:hypothetical protein
MGQWMNSYLDRLERVRGENLAGGGNERLEIQGKLGKLTARERIAGIEVSGTPLDRGVGMEAIETLKKA